MIWHWDRALVESRLIDKYTLCKKNFADRFKFVAFVEASYLKFDRCFYMYQITITLEVFDICK